MRPGERAAKFIAASNQYMSRGADLTGNADSDKGTIFAAMQLNSSGAFAVVVANTGSYFFLQRKNTNVIEVLGKNAGGATVLQLNTVATYTASPAWVYVLSSWDLSVAGRHHLYINDVSDKNALTFTVGQTIDYTRANWVLGATTTPSLYYDGAFMLWFTPGLYYDFSSATNRRKFLKESIKCENLGTDGSFPSGTAPLIYVRDGTGFNWGTGGNFSPVNSPYTVNGPGGVRPDHKTRR